MKEKGNTVPKLKGSQTETNLKEAFAGESQANRRYLYFAQKADVEGYPDVAALFRSVAEGETGHAFGHFDFLKEVGDPATGVPVGPTVDNFKSAIEGETYEYTEMYPGFAKTARDEGFEEIAEWLETLARAEKSHAGRFTKGLETLVFECLDTVRFQVQEMARVEKIISDEAIQVELDIYNRLLPGERELSASLFIELTTEAELRQWLPTLVGIERAIGVSFDGDLVASEPEAEHAAALTRDTVTPAVHSLRFGFSAAQVAAFAGASEVALESLHPEYGARTVLPAEVRRELLGDLEGTTKPLDMS